MCIVLPKHVCKIHRSKHNSEFKQKWPLSLEKNKITLELVECHDTNYVTISHVWRENPDSELSKMETRPNGAEWDIFESPPGKISNICSAVANIENNDNIAIWIDSVCINQQDTTAKGLEISKMDDIYKNAKITYVVLNKIESSKAAKKLSSLIRKNKDLKYKPNPSGGFPEIDCEWDEDDQKEYLRQLDILTADRWFSRCWTLQETVLSKNIHVLTPDGTIDLREMLLYGNGLYERVLKERLKYSRDMVRQSARYNALQLHMFNFEKKGSAHYCLHLLRDRECEEIKDVIYSVRGLIFYGKKLHVNYDSQDKDVMKGLVELGVKHGDLTMFCCLSSYYSQEHSYVPVLNRYFLKDIQNVANYNFVDKGKVTKNNIEIKGRIIGSVMKVWQKNWDKNIDLHSQIDGLKKFFGLENQEDDIFKYGIGVINKNYEWNTITIKSSELKTIERIMAVDNAVWKKIISIKLNPDVNKNYSGKNCVFCNQNVDTSEGRAMRSSHEGHQSILNGDTFVIQASGIPKKNDLIIDIGNRNWAGTPVFVIVDYNKKENTYTRTGVTRDTILIVGGRVYSEDPKIFKFS
jgi:hypothetical protein